MTEIDTKYFNIINLGDETISGKRDLVEPCQTVEVPQTSQGKPVYDIGEDGQAIPRMENVTLIAVRTPTRWDWAHGSKVINYDKINDYKPKNAGQVAGSNFGTIRTFENLMDQRGTNGYKNTYRSSKCQIGGETVAVQIGMSMIESSHICPMSTPDELLKHPLHKAGYRLEIDEYGNRSFYGLRNTKPATPDQVFKTYSEAHNLINGDKARTGA